MPFTPEQLKAYRLKLRAEGVCTRCHKRKGDPLCQECRSVLRQTLIVSKIKWGKEGRCRDCGADSNGYYHCPKCRKRNASAMRKRRKRNIENGKCAHCGKPKDNPYLYECVNCQIRRKTNKEIAKSWV